MIVVDLDITPSLTARVRNSHHASEHPSQTAKHNLISVTCQNNYYGTFILKEMECREFKGFAHHAWALLLHKSPFVCMSLLILFLQQVHIK